MTGHESRAEVSLGGRDGRAAIVVASGVGFERFARHCARYFAISPRTHPRGVFRFRTLEEAQAARERVTTESIRLGEMHGR
jgi:hypothetical protein